jgi:hypothetical protein
MKAYIYVYTCRPVRAAVRYDSRAVMTWEPVDSLTADRSTRSGLRGDLRVAYSSIQPRQRGLTVDDEHLLCRVGDLV